MIWGDREWHDLYAWEYWQHLRPPAPARKGGVEDSLRTLRSIAASASSGTSWWSSGDGADAAARMLAEHGFCVLDDFLPAQLADSVAASARQAWQDGRMGAGLLGGGGGDHVRGDAVLWVNTEDPAATLAPREGQATAAVAALGPMLSDIDALVSEVLAPRVGGRLGAVATRSHAMFTCYPGGDDRGGEPCDRAQGYLRHVDNDWRTAGGRNNGRVLTTILYLNPGWREGMGGAVRLFERAPPLQVRGEVLPVLNRLLAFWADEVPHEVLPPSGHDRFACTFWYLSRAPGPNSVPFSGAPASAAPPPRAGSASGTAFLD